MGSTGLTLGAALAQPLVAFVMVYWGWRASFYIFIPLGMALFWVWWRYATDDPADHASMTQAELADIQRPADPGGRAGLVRAAGDAQPGAERGPGAAEGGGAAP